MLKITQTNKKNPQNQQYQNPKKIPKNPQKTNAREILASQTNTDATGLHEFTGHNSLHLSSAALEIIIHNLSCFEILDNACRHIVWFLRLACAWLRSWHWWTFCVPCVSGVLLFYDSVIMKPITEVDWERHHSFNMSSPFLPKGILFHQQWCPRIVVIVGSVRFVALLFTVPNARK